LKIQSVLIILGMHRSGTSALCGTLHRMGLEFGENLLGANEHNERGHFENNEVIKLNDGLLEIFGYTWHTPFLLPHGWEIHPSVIELRDKAESIIFKYFSSFNLFGIKDPRLCILLPFWQEIMNGLSIEMHYMIALRHPYEIAQSLKKRDQLSLNNTYTLWANHLISLERSTRGKSRCFISFNELMNQNNSAFPHKSAEFLKQLRLIPSPPEVFVNSQLRHHIADDENEKNVPSIILDLYHVFNEFLKENQYEGLDNVDHLEKLINQYEEYQSLFYHHEVINNYTLISEKNKVLEEHLNSEDGTTAHAVNELYRAKEKYEINQRDLLSIKAVAKECLLKNQKLETELKINKKRNYRLNLQLENIRKSWSWRLASPFRKIVDFLP